MGELTKEIVNKKQNTGYHTVRFKADNLNSGIYYYRLEVDGKIQAVKRMLYLK